MAARTPPDSRPARLLPGSPLSLLQRRWTRLLAQGRTGLHGRRSYTRVTTAEPAPASAHRSKRRALEQAEQPRAAPTARAAAAQATPAESPAPSPAPAPAAAAAPPAPRTPPPLATLVVESPCVDVPALQAAPEGTGSESGGEGGGGDAAGRVGPADFQLLRVVGQGAFGKARGGPPPRASAGRAAGGTCSAQRV